MFEYKVGDITYRRYNKKYITPEIFNAYKVYALTIMASLVSLIFVLGFYDMYVEYVILDIVFAISFLLMATVIKRMYTNGTLNRCVDHEGVAYKIAAAYALFTQVAFWRTIIAVPAIAFISGIDSIEFSPAGIFAIIIMVLAYMVTFGVFSSYKYKNRQAQKVFSAVIDGPVAMNEDCNELLKQNMIAINQLNHPEMATPEFFECQSQFHKSAREVKTITTDYDKKWRAYLACGNSPYSNTNLEHTILYNNLLEASNKHRANAIKLNKVVDKINKQPYVPVVTKQTTKKITRTTVSNVSQNTNTEPVVDKKINEKSRKSLWDKDVNWY